MLTVAPLASLVHAGPTQAEQTVMFRSVLTDVNSTQTHNSDLSKHCYPADSMTGRETVDEGMYKLPSSILMACFYKSLARFC